MLNTSYIAIVSCLILLWMFSLVYAVSDVYYKWDRYNCPHNYFNNPFIEHVCHKCVKADGTRHSAEMCRSYFGPSIYESF